MLSEGEVGSGKASLGFRTGASSIKHTTYLYTSVWYK